MKIALASDHGGYELKNFLFNWLKINSFDVVDLGNHKFEKEDDYPDFAKILAENIIEGKAERGILICGSGVGASVAANKFKGIRAAVCHDTYSARQGMEHDAMNVLCLGARIIGIELAKELVSAFLNANYLNEERLNRRLKKVINIEAGM